MALQIKIVLLGQTAVGKTSIAQQFVNSKFGKDHHSTIGVSFLSKVLEFNNGLDTVKILLWDTAGQEKYKSLAQMYYKDAQVALLVYDITQKSTFDDIQFWVKELEANASSNVFKYILGNKSDLINFQQVLYQSVCMYAETIGAVAKEISAKENIGIRELFEEICFQVYPALKDRKDNTENIMNENPSDFTNGKVNLKQTKNNL